MIIIQMADPNRLRANDGARIGCRLRDGAKIDGTMFRVRMCFGRGLILARAPVAIRAKERRATTKAPPGETFIAVANSRESRPFPSRVRTKTGMARSNRAHFRCSFLDRLTGTKVFHPNRAITYLYRHLRGQTLNKLFNCLNQLKIRYQ